MNDENKSKPNLTELKLPYIVTSLCRTSTVLDTPPPHTLPLGYRPVWRLIEYTEPRTLKGSEGTLQPSAILWREDAAPPAAHNSTVVHNM